MMLYYAAVTVVILEAILLLVWVYHVLVRPNGTDPAGRGIAQLFLIGGGVYVAAGIILISVAKTWSLVLALVLAAIPVTIVAIGVSRYYRKEKIR